MGTWDPEADMRRPIRLIEHFKKHEGVEFVTMAEVADDFKKRNAPAEGALMPAEAGQILKK